MDELEPDSVLNRTDVYGGALRFGDDDESVSIQVGHKRDESQQDQPGSILDPPSQSLLVRSFYNPQPSQHHNSIDDSHASWNNGEHTEFSLIGEPPGFPWDPNSTRPLAAMHDILLHAGAKSTRVSLLAVVIDVRMPTRTANGKTRAGWDLADSSGALISLTLWSETATLWCGVIRRGDVVFLGDVTLSKYLNKLQITAQDHKSALQICYRTHVASEDDEVYVFREEHSDLSVPARKVLEQARWFAKAYPSRR